MIGRYDNYPPGVTDAHPHFNPPEETECPNCGEDVMPATECECGEIAPSEEELAEAAADAAADAAYDRMRDGYA